MKTARLTGGLLWGWKPLIPASISRRWLSLPFKPLRLHHRSFPCAASSSTEIASSLATEKRMASCEAILGPCFYSFDFSLRFSPV